MKLFLLPPRGPGCRTAGSCAVAAIRVKSQHDLQNLPLDKCATMRGSLASDNMRVAISLFAVNSIGFFVLEKLPPFLSAVLTLGLNQHTLRNAACTAAVPLQKVEMN